MAKSGTVTLIVSKRSKIAASVVRMSAAISLNVLTSHIAALVHLPIS